MSKWKCHLQNEAGIPKGIVVEEQGSIVRARLCDLKPGAPFDIESTLSYGTHFPARKAIIFPLGMPDSASVEQWMQAGGAHLSVVFDANASRLTGDFLSSSGQQSLQFTRYQ